MRGPISAFAALLLAGCVAVNPYDIFTVRDGGAPPDDAGPRDAGPGCTLGCDDNNPCTQDSCIASACSNSPLEGTACAPRESCAGSSCSRCEPGFLDCDGMPGCEVSSGSNNLHCGACNNPCTAGSCVNGSCVTCTIEAECPDDGLPCTGLPTCVASICTYPVLADQCFIDGVCYPTGASELMGTPFANACHVCSSITNPSGWSPSGPGVVCDDHMFCTTGDICSADGFCVFANTPCAAPLVCDEALDRCSCTQDLDCGAPIDNWDACVYSDPCASNGTRSGTRITPRCVAGACMLDTMVVSDTNCPRSTDDLSCGPNWNYGGCQARPTALCRGGICQPTNLLCSASAGCVAVGDCTAGPFFAEATDCARCFNGTCCP